MSATHSYSHPLSHNHQCIFNITYEPQGGRSLIRALGFSSFTDKKGALKHILNGGRQLSDEDVNTLKRYRLVHCLAITQLVSWLWYQVCFLMLHFIECVLWIRHFNLLLCSFIGIRSNPRCLTAVYGNYAGRVALCVDILFIDYLLLTHC